MATIKYNVKGVDIKGDRPVPKPGVYRCKVISCADAKPDNKDRRLEVQYEIVEKGDYKGVILYDYINLESEAAEWKLAQFINAMGLPESGKLDPDKLVGTALSVRTSVDPGNDQYAPSARPRTLMPLDGDDDEATEEADDDESSDDDNADEDDADNDEESDDDSDDDDDEDEETWSKDELEELDDADLTDVAFGYTDEEDDEIEGVLDEDDKDEYVKTKKAKGKKPKTVVDREALITAILETQEGDEDDDEDDDTPDYDSMEVKELRALAKERKLDSKGSKKVLIARLQKDDEPF